MDMEYAVLVNNNTVAEFHDYEHALGTVDQIQDQHEAKGIEDVMDVTIHHNNMPSSLVTGKHKPGDLDFAVFTYDEKPIHRDSIPDDTHFFTLTDMVKHAREMVAQGHFCDLRAFVWGADVSGDYIPKEVWDEFPPL